ncbi:MAG: hypothetical protein EOO71_32605, partial [Myxococcaceae bacterium]
MHGAVDAVCQDAARLLREGQAARAYTGLVASSRSLPMTPRLAATLVRCALKAGTERAVITLLDAAMVTERGAVRREVRRQLSRVLRRTGQEARAAAVLNGLLMDAPDDARARYVLDVLRERQAKSVTSRRTAEEDEESRTKTVEVSALALSDPERGNTVVELPTVSVEAKGASSKAARADTVQVPLGEWAGLGRMTARGPDFPWEDEGPGKARAVTPAQGARMPPAGDAEGVRATSVTPVGAQSEARVERPLAVSAEPSMDSEEAAEPERADVAESFRSTDLPFVTSETDRPVSEGRAERELASPVGVGAAVDARAGAVDPAAVVETNAEAGAALTGAGPRHSLDAGADVPSESLASTVSSALAEALDTGKSTQEEPLSSQSDAVLAVGVSTQGADDTSAPMGGTAPVEAARTSDEELAAALGVSSPVDVAQASDEKLAAALGVSASVDPRASDEELAAALGVSLPVEAAQAPDAKPAASSHVEVTVQALDEKAETASVPSRADVALANDEGSAPPSASSSLSLQAPDGLAVSPEAAVPPGVSGLPKASDAHATAPTRPLPQDAARPEAEVPSTDLGAKPPDASTPSSRRDTAKADASSPTDSDIASSLALKSEATLPPARTPTAQETAPAPLEAAQASGGSPTSSEGPSTAEPIPSRSTPEPSQEVVSDKDAAAGRKPSRVLDSVLVQGAPSHAFDEDESTSEMIPPRPSDPVVNDAPPKATDTDKSKPRPLSAVLVPGAPAMAFDQEEPTSELIPPAQSDARKDASPSVQARDEKSRAQPPAPSPRRTTVLVPAASNPAFEEEESTSEVIPPGDAAPSPATPASKRDSGRFPSVNPSASAAEAEPAGASAVPSSEEGAELARSQREESQLIARRAWRELAQLYLKRADRAKDAPARAEALTRLAEVMENELQDSAGAARMYREIVELTGERTALREQVRLLSLREDASLVRRALDDAIKRARTSRARAIALLTRGERQLNMGAPAKAREDLEAAEALVPGLLPVLAGLVRCVSAEELPAHAERLRAACAAAPRRAPDRLDALKVLARTAEESLGDLRIAQWAWAEVLVESPDSEQPREHLLALARRLGDLPALSQLLHAQLAREPRGPAARKAHLERVATLESMGDAGAALAELRQAVRFEPGHKEAWLLLADRCTEREQMGEAAWALENAATATEDDEERQRMWERLALFCREVLHNTERARIYARRAESLRKSREVRARPPAPELPRPVTAAGVPPPSVLVAPPVPTGRVPVKSKDLSDEVTSNTDMGSLVAAEASAPTAEKRSAQAKDGAARKSEALGAKASSQKPGRGSTVGEDAEKVSRAASVKAPSGSHAPVADAGARKSGVAKTPSGSHASVVDAGARKSGVAKTPSGSHASVVDAGARKSGITKDLAESHSPVADAGARKSGAVKMPSGRHASVADAGARKAGAAKDPTEGHSPVRDATAGARKSGTGKAPSGSHAPVADAASSPEASRKSDAVKAPSPGAAPSTEAPRRSTSAKAVSGGAASAADTSPNAEVSLKASPAPTENAGAKGRKSGAAKAPPESPPSLADAAPGPSTSARAPASKSARGAVATSGQASDTGLPARGPAPTRAEEARAPAATPRERTTAFGASLAPASEPVPSQVLSAPPSPSAVSRKAAASTPDASREPAPAAPKARAAARADNGRPPLVAPPSHPWDDEEKDPAPPPTSPRNANAEANARNAPSEGATRGGRPLSARAAARAL